MLTLRGQVDILKCDELAGLLVPATVYAAETTLTEQFLLLVLVDDLSRVEGPPLVVVVQDVTIPQVENVIVMEVNALGGVHYALGSLFEFEL